MIASRSQTAAIYPVFFPIDSQICPANSPRSPIGEYFLKITSPSFSVYISSGSPSRIRRVRRISLGITTRPRSSMRRTMPVAFIYAPPMPFVLYWFQSYCLHTQEKYAGKAAPHNSAGASASIVNCQFHRFTFLRKCSTFPLFLCCSAYFSVQKPCEILWIVVGFPVFYTEFPFQHARSVLY